ncbi:tellurite resistance TerB family protein [Loktanella sp. S4079]|uniref:tellurite resistance TerB family protein n=1 Tax=Loktanella sp. S4079 TaxID=579483 RepID=UPI0005F9F037|nr:TerB family tellurite resistance protein [Loktanella sp. S4079]KJZ18949.1 hypothetical protein TW80_12820 [Loktanella sp. S4079]
MFDNLLAFFCHHGDAKNPTSLPEADVRHAMGALLVRAAKADDAYLFEEITLIDKVLAERYAMNPVQAAKMRASCETLERQLPKTQDIAGILQNAISDDEKIATLRALWRVVYADDIRHEKENKVLHEIEQLFGIPEDRAKQIQQDVAEGK